MEKLAENQVTITKDLFLEGMLRISRDGYGKFARKAVLLIFGLWLGFLLYTLAAGGDVTDCLELLVILSLAAVWICIGMPRSNARRLWRAMEGTYGNNLHRTTSFYADHLQICGEGVDRQIAYGEIRQILRTRRLLILVCDDKTGVLVARNGFRKGTEEEVMTLLCGAKNKE